MVGSWCEVQPPAHNPTPRIPVASVLLYLWSVQLLLAQEYQISQGFQENLMFYLLLVFALMQQNSLDFFYFFIFCLRLD